MLVESDGVESHEADVAYFVAKLYLCFYSSPYENFQANRNRAAPATPAMCTRLTDARKRQKTSATSSVSQALGGDIAHSRIFEDSKKHVRSLVDFKNTVHPASSVYRPAEAASSPSTQRPNYHPPHSPACSDASTETDVKLSFLPNSQGSPRGHPKIQDDIQGLEWRRQQRPEGQIILHGTSRRLSRTILKYPREQYVAQKLP